MIAVTVGRAFRFLLEGTLQSAMERSEGVVSQVLPPWIGLAFAVGIVLFVMRGS